MMSFMHGFYAKTGPEPKIVVPAKAAQYLTALVAFDDPDPFVTKCLEDHFDIFRRRRHVRATQLVELIEGHEAVHAAKPSG